MVVPHSDPVTVVIVDDHESYAEALAIALSRDPRVQVVDHVGDLESALRSVRQHAPDVVLLDWHLNRTDGVEALHRFRLDATGTCVVILTAFETPALRRAALAAGATDVAAKESSLSALADLVVAAPTVRETTPSEGSAEAVRGQIGDDDPHLTPRQVEVLWLLAKGLDVDAIAGTLFLSVNSVRTYTKAAIRALGAHSRLEAIARARELGLLPDRLPGTPPG